MIKEVTLKTGGMFDDNDPNDSDYELWKSIAEFMNGERAWVAESLNEQGEYAFLGLKNGDKGKELAYMMEQDSMMGAYLDSRDEFDLAWEAEEYDPGGCFYLKGKYIEFDSEN